MKPKNMKPKRIRDLPSSASLEHTPAQPLPLERKVSAVVIALWRFVRRLSAFAWREELAHAEAGYQCLNRNSAKLQQRYNELLYEVDQRHEGESRHDTARRYIREREQRIEGPSCDASANDEDHPLRAGDEQPKH